ncbi:PREDICTED: cuticle protein 5-like [Vollenhovia emeryi]|uniref:cuticle protein 5-like n=1 Tax=Vollenhovia emeryi TaxID=411798 RepID=UPI0005F4BE24|nr:PREDICTED: cuticle protein 5-like [Vollenhovia emeryi]
MRSLVLLIATVATTLATPAYYQKYHGSPAPIGHDGRVLDTPEVAHAKAAHLAAVAEAAARVPHGAASYAENGDYHGYAKPVSVGHQMYHSGYGYHGPPAPLDHDGRVVDTPEVARAKAAHLAAYNHIASATPVAYDHSQIYKPPVYGHDGYYGDSSGSLSHDDGANDGYDGYDY